MCVVGSYASTEGAHAHCGVRGLLAALLLGLFAWCWAFFLLVHDESRPALILVPFEAGKHGHFSEFVVSLSRIGSACEFSYEWKVMKDGGRSGTHLFLVLLVDGV